MYNLEIISINGALRDHQTMIIMCGFSLEIVCFIVSFFIDLIEKGIFYTPNITYY